jgi:hypothetical protein
MEMYLFALAFTLEAKERVLFTLFVETGICAWMLIDTFRNSLEKLIFGI